MTTFETINLLAKRYSKNVKSVALDLGFSENLFYRWKKTQPKASDLAKVADYFHVSVDYLLGREEIKYSEVDLKSMLTNAQCYNTMLLEDKDREFLTNFLQTYFDMKGKK